MAVVRNDLVRIGRIAAINSKNGMVKVAYADRDGASTKELPVLKCTDEYRNFKIGERVLVLHLSNGSSRAVVLGGIWNVSSTVGQKLRMITSKISDVITTLIVDAVEDIVIKTTGKIIFEDEKWTTSLTEIMDRLYALDGDDTGRKKG